MIGTIILLLLMLYVFEEEDDDTSSGARVFDAPDENPYKEDE